MRHRADEQRTRDVESLCRRDAVESNRFAQLPDDLGREELRERVEKG